MSESPLLLCERFDPQRHDRDGFTLDPNYKSLERYLKQQASQDERRNACRVYVMPSFDLGQLPLPIVGYCTLSMASIPTADLPPLPGRIRPAPYPEAPAALLGRLAVDRRFQGGGNGRRLLVDAFQRCLEGAERLACWAMVTDPIDERAAAFYARFGFQPLTAGDRPRLFLTIATIERLLSTYQ